MSEKIFSRYKQFKSLHYMLRNVANTIKKPSDVFLMVKTKDKYEGITYAEIFEQINAISAFLYNKGIRKGDRVALIIENCPEYMAFDQGLLQLGLVNVSIYPTLGEPEIEYIINDSGAKAILVGTPFLLKRINKIKSNCPSLDLVIAAFDAKDNEMTYAKMIEEGKALYPSLKNEIETELEKVTYSDLACLLYTSGTTGKPKGAMLSHNNFMSNLAMAVDLFPIISKDFKFLSFLPLCHVYERTCTYYLSCFVGSTIAFAQSMEALTTNIQEVKPTAICTVPRLLERIEEKVRKTATAQGGVKLKIFNWALGVGKTQRLNKQNGRKNSLFLNLQLAIAEKLVYKKIKAKLGGNMSIMISGGGALPQHVGEFFADLNMLVIEGYGLTETSPFATANPIELQIWGTVGKVAEGNEIGIQNVETKEFITIQTNSSYDPNFECAEGEIFVKGPNVVSGYWNLPKETAEAIDKDGWLHTGDVGKFHKGYLKITDRIKNILVNSFGKNIYPTPIENVYIKSNRIEQIFLLGDKQEYLTAIIVPSREEMKDVFKFTDEYFNDPENFITDQNIISWVNEDMKKLETELGKFERVKSFILKRRPFSIEGGELTPTQKTKRKVIETKFEAEIKGMYSNIS